LIRGCQSVKVMAEWILWLMIGVLIIHIIGSLFMFEHFSTLMNVQSDVIDKMLKHLLDDKQKSACDEELGFDITGNEIQQVMVSEQE
jgi:hypothetical protein